MPSEQTSLPENSSAVEGTVIIATDELMAEADSVGRRVG